MTISAPICFVRIYLSSIWLSNRMFAIRLRRRTWMTLCLVLLTSFVVAHAPLWAQNSIDVRSDRWLRISAISGDVEYFRNSTRKVAEVGDFLTAPGEGVRTGANASCVVEVDNGVGTIRLNEHTELTIRALDFAADNGQITRLTVPYGNVILNLRRFTHRGSELEIETPSGVSGVRGTEFGLRKICALRSQRKTVQFMLPPRMSPLMSPMGYKRSFAQASRRCHRNRFPQNRCLTTRLSKRCVTPCGI